MKCIYISYIMYHVSYIIYLSCIIYNIIIYICIYNIIIVYHTIVFVDGRFLATAQGVCSTQVGDRELGSRGPMNSETGFSDFRGFRTDTMIVVLPLNLPLSFRQC